MSEQDQKPGEAPELERGDAAEGALIERMRHAAGSLYMGSGFKEQIGKLGAKRRAYEFWYHPFTELALFVLIVVSIVLLIVEASMPDRGAVGWLGGLSSGEISGWFFWADTTITAVFLVEYISKLWITPSGRRWYFVRHNWIELLAILPVLRVFRAFRIFRAARILRLMRVLRSVRIVRAGSMFSKVFRGFGDEVGKNRAGNFVLLAYFVSVMAFGTIGVMVFEKGADSGFRTLGDGLWWSVVTLSTVGYGDIVPETAGGKIIGAGVVLLGLGFWSLLTGIVTSSLVERARKKGSMGLDVLGIEDHVVLCGWNENAHQLVRDFRHYHPDRRLLVLSQDSDLDVAGYARVHHVLGDPTTNEALDTAGIESAQSVVILAEHGEATTSDRADARSVMTCLTVASLVEDAHIVVELRDPRNRVHALNAGANDTVVTESYGGSLLSHSVQSPGISDVYNELFDAADGARFRERPVDQDLVGRPLRIAASRHFEDEGECVVGLLRGDELNYADDAGITVQPGDRFAVISGPDGGGGALE